MPEADDDELLTLRNRAYGPSPDIHDDLIALRRLDHLENEKKLAWTRTQTDVPQRRVVELEASLTLAEVEPPPSRKQARWSWPIRLFRTIRQARRSSVLIAVGAVLVAMSLLAAIILVPRVQVDPLQTGAEQVARLSLDSSFETPAFFSAGTGKVFGFQQFHGLRAVVSKTGFFAVGDNQNPAIVQFRPDTEGFPDELKSAFPKPSALQFVYDQTHNEVVIFAQAD